MINVIRCDISVHFDQRICGMQYWDIVLTFCVRSQKRRAQAIINCWKFANGWLNTISYSANQKILQISLKHVKNLYTIHRKTRSIWIHSWTGDKRFKCVLCPYETHVNSNLPRHIKRHHVSSAYTTIWLTPGYAFSRAFSRWDAATKYPTVVRMIKTINIMIILMHTLGKTYNLRCESYQGSFWHMTCIRMTHCQHSSITPHLAGRPSALSFLTIHAN